MSILNSLSPHPKRILEEIIDRLIHLEELVDAEEIAVYEQFSVLKSLEKTIEETFTPEFLKVVANSLDFSFRDKETMKSKGFEVVAGRTLYDFSNAANYKPYQDALEEAEKAKKKVKEMENMLIANLRQKEKFGFESVDTDGGEIIPYATVKGAAKITIKVKI